jgi:hypothetical protein
MFFSLLGQMERTQIFLLALLVLVVQASSLDLTTNGTRKSELKVSPAKEEKGRKSLTVNKIGDFLFVHAS